MPRFGGALDIVQTADPSTPTAGRQKLYFKSDGSLYMKDSSGLVTKVNGGAAPSNMVTTDTVQTISETKTFNKMPIATGLRLQNNGDYSSGSTSLFLRNQAGTKEWEFFNNPAGEWGVFDKTRGMGIFVAKSDCKDMSLELRSTGGVFSGTVTGTLGVFDGANRVYSASNPPPGGGGGGSGVELVKTADQAIQSITAGGFVDIADLSWAAAANTSYQFEGVIWYTVAATTTGHRWGFVGPGSALANIVMEYQTSATAWATYDQQHNNTSMAGTPPMSTVTASALAGVPNIVRVKGYIRNGATAGTIKMQGASELTTAAVTVLKGSSITYKAV